MTTFGQLRFIPSADIGDLGPHEGQAVLYLWRWYFSALGSSPWLVLVAATVGLKVNRDRRVLLILMPLAIVNLLYLSFKKVWGMTSSSAVQFDVLFQSLAIGLSLLWLVAPALKGRGFVRVAIAFGSVMAVAGLCILSYGTTSSEETAIFLGVLAFLGGVLILAPTVAARLCGGRYRPVGFMLWMGLWTVVGGVVAIVGSTAFVFLAFSSGPSLSELLGVILMAMMAGAIFGLCLYTLYLPYMVLGFVSPFFRVRLQACLNLNPPGERGGEESLASTNPV